jgi:hypothetical protein
MNAPPDRPSLLELEELEVALETQPLDHSRVIAAIEAIEESLGAHADDLEQAGGLLDEKSKASRPALARLADELQEEVLELEADAGQLLQAADEGASDEDFIRSAREFLVAVRRHRSGEAGILQESAQTDVGAGD